MSCKSTYCECDKPARAKCGARLVTINDFDMMCRAGYGCGLQTVNEAYSQLACHYDAFFLIEEAGQRLTALEEYINSRDGWGDTIRGVKGVAWCDALDAEEKSFWESQR